MDDITWVAHFPKITYTRHKKMVAYFLTGHSLEKMEIDDFFNIGIDLEIAHEIIVWREKNPKEKIFEKIEKNSITPISIQDQRYPKLLKEINDPPLVLFVRGQIYILSEGLNIGVVGTRRYTTYGKEVCVKICNELTKNQITIISGLALGIDSFSHQAALDNGGKTIAVLGSGIDRESIYPRFNLKLAENIIKNNGAIISEYPPGTKPTGFSFPARNRIIAGLSQGVLVIEAPLKSGSLITARHALDYNREVMAIPHPINSENGTGNNELIKRGAALISSAQDVFESLNWNYLNNTQKRKLENLTPEEKKILDLLSQESWQIEKIINSLNLPSEQILSTLTLLEMRSMIKNIGGGYYTKI